MSLSEGLQILKIATHHDHFQRYSEASFLYTMAAESLQQAFDEETNEKKKEVLLNKIEQYKNRAIYLNSIKSIPIPAQPAVIERSDSKPKHVEKNEPDLHLNNLNLEENENFNQLQEALDLIESAKGLQLEGINLEGALEKYKKGMELLAALYKAENSVKVKGEIQRKIEFVKNLASHLSVHLQAKSKFTEKSYEEYLKACDLIDSANEQDNLGKYKEAVRFYEAANVHFRKALQAETDTFTRKVIAKRMHICHQRVEQLTHYFSSSQGNSPQRPVQFGYSSGCAVPSASAPVETSIWDKVSSFFTGAPAEPDRSVVGTFIDHHPDSNGEWVESVVMKDTKTMTDPIDNSIYTAFIMSVTTKVMKDGVEVDRPKWEVIRRYKQFRMFHAKLQSVGATNFAEFPKEHVLGNVLQPMVVNERVKLFQKYFNALLARPPHPAINDVILRFVRNTFKQAAAAN